MSHKQSQNQPLPDPPLDKGGRKANLHCNRLLPCQGEAGEGLPLTSAGQGLVLPYNKNLTALARENRSNPTKAESKIWREVLRMRQFAQYKFLRQKAIGGYIVDFYCSELQLVIEIDGDSEDPEINVSRVLTRVAEGGHNVDRDKIVERYHRSLDFLADAVGYANRAYIFDNSSAEKVWIAEVTDGETIELKTDSMPNWFKAALWDKFALE